MGYPNGRKPIVIEAATQEMTEERKKNKLYKGEEDSDGRISSLVGEKMLLLADISERGRTNLKSLEEVQAVTIAYLESCRRAEMVPTFEGLCCAMGFSRQAVYAFLKTRKADDPVIDYLEKFRTMSADIMTQASLKRYIDNATTIFSLKNMSGLGFSDKGDAIPETQSAQYDADQGVEFYRERYGRLLEE